MDINIVYLTNKTLDDSNLYKDFTYLMQLFIIYIIIKTLNNR